MKPILSPHAVETTIFYFGVLWERGYRSYAHLGNDPSGKLILAYTARRLTEDERAIG